MTPEEIEAAREGRERGIRFAVSEALAETVEALLTRPRPPLPHTAGLLREIGFPIPLSIPDCAEARGVIDATGAQTGIEFSWTAIEPFHWIRISGTVTV